MPLFTLRQFVRKSNRKASYCYGKKLLLIMMRVYVPNRITMERSGVTPRKLNFCTVPLAFEDKADRILARCGWLWILLAMFKTKNIDWKEIITINPEQCGGRPCIRGMRIRISDVLDLLAAGLTPEQIVDELPDLTPEDIAACLMYAAKRMHNPTLVYSSWKHFGSTHIYPRS